MEEKKIVRGGFGEPYCSDKCYNEGGRYASSVMLKNQRGVCGVCRKPVTASMYGPLECAAMPYEGVTLYVCLDCSEKGKAHLQSYNKCCMCGKPL